MEDHKILTEYIENTFEAYVLDLPEQELFWTIELERAISHKEKVANAIADYESFGEEVDPKICRRQRCDRLTIAHSSFCKRHHYENIRGKQALQFLYENDAING